MEIDSNQLEQLKTDLVSIKTALQKNNGVLQGYIQHTVFSCNRVCCRVCNNGAFDALLFRFAGIRQFRSDSRRVAMDADRGTYRG